MPERSAAKLAVAGAAGLAVLTACLAVVAATPGDAHWINDCGNKALVAERLLQTGFGQATFTRPMQAIDPDGRWFAIPPPFALRRGSEFVSAYPLAYPAIAVPTLAAFGPRGLRLPAAVGAAAASALLAAWLAPVLGRGGALLAGLVLGLASPLFFYGVTVWEHSLTVALALASSMLLARPRSASWCAAGVLIGVACWLREELALMLPAVILAALLLREPRKQIGAFAAGAALPLAALAAFNASFFGTPLGGHVAANLAGGIFAERAAPGRLSVLPGLLAGFGHGSGERRAFVSVALALCACAFLPRRIRDSTALVIVVAAVALFVWGIATARLLAGPSRLAELVRHNGLLLEWPLFALAGVGVPRVLEDPRFRERRIGIVAGFVFAALVLVTGILLPSGFGAQVGAGVHWGPRLLLPALPAFVCVAAASVAGRSPAARLAAGTLALAGLASSALGIFFLAQQELDAARFADLLRGEGPRVIVTTNPFLGQHLASLWEAKPMLLARDLASLQGAAEAVRAHAEPAFLFVGPAGVRLANTLVGVGCTPAFQHRGRYLDYFDLDVERCVYAGPDGPPARPAPEGG